MKMLEITLTQYIPMYIASLIFTDLNSQYNQEIFKYCQSISPFI